MTTETTSTTSPQAPAVGGVPVPQALAGETMPVRAHHADPAR